MEEPDQGVGKTPCRLAQRWAQQASLEETSLGVSMVVIGIIVVVVSLIAVTKNMKALIAERLEASMNRVLGRGGGLVAMVIGMLVTISVQSSSITTSILIPMAAAGVISLRNIYPVTLGANVGTTITALLAALAASGSDALTIALFTRGLTCWELSCCTAFRSCDHFQFVVPNFLPNSQ